MATDDVIVRDAFRELSLAADHAWDFPLSRAEKFERVIFSLENELELADSESNNLRLQLEQLQRSSLNEKPQSLRVCSCMCRCGASQGQPLPKAEEDVPVTSISLGGQPEHGFDQEFEEQQNFAGTSSGVRPFDDPVGFWPSFQLLRRGMRHSRNHREVPRFAEPPQMAWQEDEMTGSVSSVQWAKGIDNSVSWLHFAQKGAPKPSYADASGEQRLQAGEYVIQLRGRTSKPDGRLADWIDVITSRGRILKIGEGHSSVPSFSFQADAGNEIIGVIDESGGGRFGKITGVQSRRLIGSSSETFSPKPHGNISSAASPTNSVARMSRASAAGPATATVSQRSSRQSAASAQAVSPAAQIRALAASGSAAKRRLSGGSSN